MSDSLKKCSNYQNVQLVTLIPSRFAFHIVTWGYLDPLNIPLNEVPRSWTSGSKQT